MPTATLKPVKRAAKGHNRFCGPAALSIIAGIDTAEASAVIRKGNGKRSVKGTSHFDLLRALSTLGYKASSAAKIYLISAGHHWQVVQGRRFCCGITKDIVSIRDPKVKRRARLVAVWKIEQDHKVNIADVLPVKLAA